MLNVQIVVNSKDLIMYAALVVTTANVKSWKWPAFKPSLISETGIRNRF